MFKKAAAFILSAVIMAGASTAVYAESIPQTITVEQEYGASRAKTWDGKAKLEAGKSYVVKKTVTISSEVTLPKGATLTLNKGAKLNITAKGTFTVKGKLVVKSGATLTVSGKLVTAKGSTVSDSGTIKLSKNKAGVTIGGKFTINKGGKLTGTPKSITLGKSAKVTVKGTNSCKKLADLLNGSTETADTSADKAAIEKMLNSFIKKVFTGDIYGSLSDVFPQSYIDELDKQLQAEAGVSLKDYLNVYLPAMLKEYGVDWSEFSQYADAVSIKVSKLTDCMSSLTDEQKAVLADCGKITKAYLVDYTVDVSGENIDASQLQDIQYTAVTAVYAGGNWYLVG